MPCSNTPKTRNPLKFAGVPQTRQQISAVSRPKFTILPGHVEEVLLLNKFFFRDSDFLCPVFAASRVQRISDLHSKFALRPHHVPKYGKHPISAEIRREKKRKKKNEMAIFCVLYLQLAACSAFQTCILNSH